jgi:hypothetical protein
VNNLYIAANDAKNENDYFMLNTIFNLNDDSQINYNQRLEIISFFDSQLPTDETYIECDDSHAGNRIPTIFKDYVINDVKIRLASFPDWDNYSTDYSLTINDNRYIRLIEN